MATNNKPINQKDIEDFAMAKAIMEGETGEIVDTSEFLKSIEESVKS
ncbi:MAG TPA: hypothetical protein VIM89_11630 [Mucilaginibacter sp.]